MRNAIISAVLVGVMSSLAFLLFLPSSTAYALTTSTNSITGWLAPDGAHLNAGIPIILFSLLGVFMGAIIAQMVNLKGSLATFSLFGLVFGSLLGVLSLGNATSGNVVPFGLIVVASVDLAFYLWKGGG